MWRFTVLRGWRLLKVAQPRLGRSCRAGRTHRLRAAAAPSPAWAGRPEEAPTRRALRRPPARSLASLSTCLQGMVFHAAMFSFARHENPQAAARSWSLTQAACRGQNGCSRGRATCTHSESGRVCPLASQPGPGDRAPALVAPRLDRRPQSRHTTVSRGAAPVPSASQVPGLCLSPRPGPVHVTQLSGGSGARLVLDSGTGHGPPGELQAAQAGVSLDESPPPRAVTFQ